MIDDFCCGCHGCEDCEHTCGLNPAEIAARKALSDELHEVYFSLKLGEKKQVPSSGQWVEYVMAKSPFDDRMVRTYRFCEAP